MIDDLKEEELEFCESFFTPACLVETMFNDFDNLADFDMEKFGHLRLYQMPMLSDEPIIDFEATAKLHNLKPKEKFELQKNVGELFCFGARRFGKTMVVETLDLLVAMLCSLAKKISLGSVDLFHIKGVLDPIKSCLQNHPIISLWKQRVTSSPNFKFELRNGTVVNSVNFNIGSRNPGEQWYGKHEERIYIEEGSLETQEVYDKRKDAIAEIGCIYRISGMTNFTKHSPAGKSFYSPENRKKTLNLPQFVNPLFTEKEKQERIEQYGGEGSINFRVFVGGEVVEDGISAIDMERVRRLNYTLNTKGDWCPEIKYFEVNKERFGLFKNILVIERPENVDRIFIATDVGKHVTEIIVIAEIGENYEYLYNISCFNLTQQEIEEVLDFIIYKTKSNVIAIDCGDGEGRGIYTSFEKKYPIANLVYYDGSMKVQVGFELNEDGSVKMDKNVPVFRYETMAEFGVKHLTQDLFYQGRCKIPKDYKFDAQFSSVIALLSGNKTIYKCLSETGDHLFDTWKVLSIAQWLKKDFNKTPAISTQDDFGCGASSW